MKNERAFPRDKNYLLKEAQDNLQDELLIDLVDKVKVHYLAKHNPLGLIDDTVRKIITRFDYPTENLDDFYKIVSVIYRYLHGDVQLEIVWDGRSPIQKYQDDWEVYFHEQVAKFCDNPHFLKAVLAACVLCPDGKTVNLAGNRMKYFIENYFEVKVYKHKGVKRKSA